MNGLPEERISPMNNSYVHANSTHNRVSGKAVWGNWMSFTRNLLEADHPSAMSFGVVRCHRHSHQLRCWITFKALALG